SNRIIEQSELTGAEVAGDPDPDHQADDEAGELLAHLPGGVTGNLPQQTTSAQLQSGGDGTAGMSQGRPLRVHDSRTSTMKMDTMKPATKPTMTQIVRFGAEGFSGAMAGSRTFRAYSSVPLASMARRISDSRMAYTAVRTCAMSVF